MPKRKKANAATKNEESLCIGNFLPVAEDVLRGLLLFDEIHLLLLTAQGVEKRTCLARTDLPFLFLLGSICWLGLLAGWRSGLGLLLFVRALELALLLVSGSG